MEKEIQLKVQYISGIQPQSSAYGLILSEVEGTRQLPVIIGAAEAHAITINLEKVPTPRPITHDLFLASLTAFGIKLKKVLIYKVKDGVFYSYIYMVQDDRTVRVDSRTSDAIALALRTDCPIYAYDSILEKESIIITEESLTEENPNSLERKSMKTLKMELEQAVKEENYELASVLRNEIFRRQ